MVIQKNLVFTSSTPSLVKTVPLHFWCRLAKYAAKLMNELWTRGSSIKQKLTFENTPHKQQIKQTTTVLLFQRNSWCIKQKAQVQIALDSEMETSLLPFAVPTSSIIQQYGWYLCFCEINIKEKMSSRSSCLIRSAFLQCYTNIKPRDHSLLLTW